MANQIIGLRADGTLPPTALNQVHALLEDAGLSEAEAQAIVDAAVEERGLRPDGTLPTTARQQVIDLIGENPSVDETQVRQIVDQRFAELPPPTADEESVIKALGFRMVVSDDPPAEPTYTLSDGTVVRVVWQKPLDVIVPVFPETPYWDTHARTVLVPSLVGVEYRVTSVTKGGSTTALNLVIPSGEAFDLDSAVSVSVPYDLRVDAVALSGYVLPHDFGWTMTFPDMNVATVFTSETFSILDDGPTPVSWQSDAALGGIPQTFTVGGSANVGGTLIKGGIARLVSRTTRLASGVTGESTFRVETTPEDLIVEFDLATTGEMPPGTATGLNLMLGGLEVWFQTNSINVNAALEGGRQQSREDVQRARAGRQVRHRDFGRVYRSDRTRRAHLQPFDYRSQTTVHDSASAVQYRGWVCAISGFHRDNRQHRDSGIWGRMMRTFNEARRRWEYAERYQHNGQAWVEVLNESEDDAVSLTTAFNEDTYMGRGTILQRDITDMPVHPRSEEMSAAMWDLSPFGPGGAWGAKTSVNTSAFGTQPIHMYVVDSTHPESSFRTFEGATAIGAPSAEVAMYMNGAVPLPTWAVPAQNGDRGMSVYDLGTGIMREYFMVTNSEGKWKGSGGYSIARPGLQNLAEDNYALQQRRGISNVAGMHNSMGFIGIAEAMNKKINHALCFTASALWSIHPSHDELLAERATWPEGRTVDNWPPGNPDYVSWPSRAADGKLERYIPESTWANNHTYTRVNPHITPTHGQWGRIPESLDPMHNPRTGEPYPEFVRVLIDAAKRYGLVATDTNLWCHAFNAEQGRTFKHVYGEDPWRSDGIIDNVYRDKYGRGGITAEDFPWDLVEWATVDWGRPVPDMNKKPYQLTPWFG